MRLPPRLWSEQIVHHAQLQPGGKSVEYSDGSVIYINYNGEAVTFNDPVMGDEVTVEAQNYVVRKGAEG